jgi:elongation factor Ts
VAKLAAHAARLLLRHPDADITQAANANLNIDEIAQEKGENVRIGRTAFLRNQDGQVGTYNHGDGRIGVLVSVSGKIEEQLLKELCLHVAGHRPAAVAVTREQLAGEVGAERALMEQRFVMDPGRTIGEVMSACNCKLVEFVRVEVGE